MRQYQVPQFITVEDKVIGPFTIKQFLYLGGGGLIIVFARLTLQPFLAWPITAIIGIFAASLAFVKINEQPLPIVVKNALFYFLRPRLYVWKKGGVRPAAPSPEKAKGPMVRAIPKLSQSKLSDLAWSLDIKEKTSE